MTALANEDVPAGGQQHSQRLLATLLGDYWFWRTEHIPSAALVELLGEFGLAEPAARAAIRRSAARGLVVAAKNGRTTSYGVPRMGHELIVRHLTRLMRFGAGDRVWDGRWTLVMFSLPEEHREDRRTLRTKLRWLGLAPLYDGVWVTPWDLGAQVLEVLAELDVGAATVGRAELAPELPVGGHPLQAWDLSELRMLYDGFLERYEPLRERVLAGAVDPAEALVTRTKIMTEWRQFPGADPELPAAILPRDWPMPAARACFVQVYDGLGAPAERRFSELLGQHAPELAGFAAHRTSDDIRRGEPVTDERWRRQDRNGWAGPLGQGDPDNRWR
ncbi:PaaX family transcriptional regulator [Nocardia sp. NBC_00416]|uniref:PaaX family transcriptional regulator n=1 Tax=Nocardia sp. NBC_00416 TaxID=2975991 RepID=UPI002E1A7EC5